MYASAAESITSSFDHPIHKSDVIVKDSSNEHIPGLEPKFRFDQYGNIFLVASIPFRPEQVDCEQLKTDSMRHLLVRRCGLDDLDFAETQQDIQRVCEQESITDEVYTVSDSIFSQLIKSIRVRNEFVKYHITKANSILPVVDQCYIGFEIIGTPESVAIRIRDDGAEWSGWRAFDPEIGSDTIKLDHHLPRGSGTKTVQFQVATPAGLAPTASVNIIADFKPIVHQVNFYKPLSTCDSGTPCPPDPIDVSYLEDSDIWLENNRLNMMNNMPVASVRKPEVVTENDAQEWAVGNAEYIFIEIVPEEAYFRQFTDDELANINITPTFDFIHQGGRDFFNLPTIFHAASRAFRGWITINKEDQGAFRDGLACIVVHFKNDCSDPSSVSAGAAEDKTSDYTKDVFNSIVQSSATVVTPTDVWAQQRNELGQLKHPVVIRPTEDPYFIFGDPNYRLNKNE